MTIKELSQLFFLKKEIAKLEKQLQDLQDAATRVTVTVSDSPRSGKVSSPTALGADICELKTMLEEIKQQRIAEYKRLLGYINSIDDSYTRQVMTLRFVDGLKWEEVADALNTTSWSVKHLCYRFVDRN
jgi:DNA-directed RNA polymerase specialized sigma24 family protein